MTEDTDSHDGGDETADTSGSQTTAVGGTEDSCSEADGSAANDSDTDSTATPSGTTVTDRTHEYVWRCTGCKAEYHERPDRCERCGATEFTEFREL